MNGYRLLLRLVPRRLREKHGAEMETMFRAQLADARGRGAIAVAAVWYHALADVAGALPATSFIAGAGAIASVCQWKGDRS